MGFRIDDYTLEEGINRAVQLIKSDKVSQIVTINPEMIDYSSKNPEFTQIVHNAEMVIPDGIGVKIALQLNGYKVQRLPGIDFAYKLLQKCAELSLPVAIIGAKEEVITKAIDNLKEQINNLDIVYYRNGYFNNDTEVYEKIKEKSPRLVLIAMGSPRQEEFISNAKKYLPPCLMIGIGGSLDVWSGMVKRAPKIYQKLGIEWLYRTITQPERFKRIFPALPLFLIKAICYKYKNRSL